MEGDPRMLTDGLILRLDDPAKWSRVSDTIAWGRAFVGARQLDALAIAGLFSGTSTPQEVAALAMTMTGHYAVVCDSKTRGYALVDPTRSKPLFFAEDSYSCVVSDSPRLALQAPVCTPPVRDALIDFAYCGYVTGTNTLFGGVQQIPGGTVLYPVSYTHLTLPTILRV